MNADYRVKVLREVRELEALRDFWQTMVRHPNADLDFFITIINFRPEIKGPAVFILYREETPCALLIGRIEEGPMEIKFGYFSVPSPQLRKLILIYGGASGIETPLAAELLVSAIRGLQKEKIVDTVLFNNLSQESSLFKAIENPIPFTCREHVLLPNPHWSTRLPVSLDDFLNKLSKNHRYGIRRMARLLETAHPGEIEVHRFTEENEVPRLCADTESIACKTYQRSLGLGVMDSPEMVARLSVHARSGSLRGYVLNIKKTPAAFWIGILYKEVLFIDFTGYDTRYHSFAPGTYLFMKLIDDVCRNSRASGIDFGFGDAIYKQRFGDHMWKEMSIMLFPATLKGLTLNVLRQSSALLNLSMSRVFSNRFLQTVKTRWRKHRAGKLNSTPAEVIS